MANQLAKIHDSPQVKGNGCIINKPTNYPASECQRIYVLTGWFIYLLDQKPIYRACPNAIFTGITYMTYAPNLQLLSQSFGPSGRSCNLLTQKTSNGRNTVLVEIYWQKQQGLHTNWLDLARHSTVMVSWAFGREEQHWNI